MYDEGASAIRLFGTNVFFCCCFLSSEHIRLPACLLYGFNRLRDYMRNAEGREWMESFIHTHTYTLFPFYISLLSRSICFWWCFATRERRRNDAMWVITLIRVCRIQQADAHWRFFFFLHHCEKKTGNKATELPFFSIHSLLLVVFFVNQHTYTHTHKLCLF